MSHFEGIIKDETEGPVTQVWHDKAPSLSKEQFLHLFTSMVTYLRDQNIL